MNIIEAAVATPDARVAITIARFNNFINDSLLEGAIDALKRIGQVKDENITVVWVPGAYELPLAAGALAEAEVPADAEASSWALSSSIRVLTACRRAVTVS